METFQEDAMNGSTTYLRRGLLGLAFAGSLGFGASQALASPAQATGTMAKCPIQGYDYYYAPCANACPGHQGYCSEAGLCRCGQIP
jgi:hypothetical protein